MRLPSPTLPPASPESLAFGGLWATLTDLAVAGMLLAAAVDAWAPPQDLAWKPLDLNRPPGLATGLQLARAAGDPEACRQALRRGGVEFTEAPDQTDRFCEIRNAVRLRDGLTRLAPPAPVMTCPVALGYAVWERHVVQPAAQRRLDAEVVRIEHYGTYSCRNVYGRVNAPPSEHARANAVDAYGFRLSDGRRVTVASHFRAEDARGRFLHEVRDGACDAFHAVLSPDYNAAHRDHLHLDFGRWRTCR